MQPFPSPSNSPSIFFTIFFSLIPLTSGGWACDVDVVAFMMSIALLKTYTSLTSVDQEKRCGYKLKIYNCIVFTGFEPQNFIFLKVSAGGLVLTYSSARYSHKHLYKVYCYRKKHVILICGQCQTLISLIFSGAGAIDKNLPAFCINVFLTFPIRSSTPYVVALLFILAFSCFEQVIFFVSLSLAGKFRDTALLNTRRAKPPPKCFIRGARYVMGDFFWLW